MKEIVAEIWQSTGKVRFALILLTLLQSSVSCGQSVCDSLQVLKGRIYGFRPLDLNDSLKSAKTIELDLFWSIAKNDPANAAKCLKDLIDNETEDSYFCFSASSLLLRLDTTDQYLPTIIVGLGKCDLNDLQLSQYLRICYFLGRKGQDIGDLAVKLISVHDAQVYLENHFITLNAVQASIFLFNMMTLSRAEELLTSAIRIENATTQHNAALLLNLLATDRGDSLIDSLSANRALADSTVEAIEKYRESLIVKEPKGFVKRSAVLDALNDLPFNIDKEFFGFAGNEKLIRSACKHLGQSDISLLMGARQRSTPGLSDEALHEYFALTSIIMTVRRKN